MKHTTLLPLLLAFTTSTSAQRVMPIGEGLSSASEAHAMLVHDGKLIVGGLYTEFNGHFRANLQAWDGSTHYDMPGAFAHLGQQVVGLLIFNGDLIAAGNDESWGHVARWDGTAWHSMGPGLPLRARSIIVHDGTLFASSGPGIYRLTNGSWQAVGGEFNALVRTLAVHEGVLYAGGDFVSNGPTSISHFARWNGVEWSQVGNGLNSRVHKLLSTPDGLILRGDMTSDANGQQIFPHWTIWQNGAFSEPQLDPGLGGGLIPGLITHPEGGFVLGSHTTSLWVRGDEVKGIDFNVRAIAQFNGVLYAAGSGPTLTIGSPDNIILGQGIGRLIGGTNRATLDIGGLRPEFSGSAGNTMTGMEALKGQGTRSIFCTTPGLVGHINGSPTAWMKFFDEPLGEHLPNAGPLANEMTGTDFAERYQRVWKVDKSSILHHAQHWNDPGHQIPEAIATWPGNGETSNGEPQHLAPFKDLNDNALYEPELGEYPIIRGDQAVLQIKHGLVYQSAAPDERAIELDLVVMHYAFADSANADIHQTVFANYQVINRGQHALMNSRFGMFVDFDLGNPMDDYVGCDSTLSLFYVYNSDALDDSFTALNGYGTRIPAQGAVFLNRTMSAHRSLGWNEFNDPQVFEGLIEGQPIAHLGHTTRFEYPGGNITEEAMFNLTSDRRSLAAIGAFDLLPGDTLCLDMAFPFALAPSGDRLESLAALHTRAQAIHAWYAQQQMDCSALPEMGVGISRAAADPTMLRLWPNPANDVLYIACTTSQGVAHATVLDATGREVLHRSFPAGSAQHQLGVDALRPGVYLLRWSDANGQRTVRFIRSDR